MGYSLYKEDYIGELSDFYHIEGLREIFAIYGDSLYFDCDDEIADDFYNEIISEEQAQTIKEFLTNNNLWGVRLNIIM